jgi:multidrug efflux pump subunit AcrA (membrane-fusion protein)
MFVDTQVVLGATSAVVAVPASAISYAPYGDSVYVVSELRGRRVRNIAASRSRS